MKNQYKRQDVFLCSHDAHANRGHRVSVYHTLFRKNCFPNGCTYFRWKCKELERRRKCYRGYSHVGKNCFGCKFFDEEKLDRSLVKVSGLDFDVFLEELHEFEDWLRDVENKEHWCLGRIGSVKPHMKQTWYPAAGGTHSERTHLMGYLVCFSDMFIGNVPFEDVTFAMVGREFQERLKFRPEDRVEFRGTLTVKDGRIVFYQLKQIQFTERGGETEPWTDSLSLVARATGTTLAYQAEKCVSCKRGQLIDVLDKTGPDERTHHRIFCLEGMPSASACTYDTSRDLYGLTCSNRYSSGTP